MKRQILTSALFLMLGATAPAQLRLSADFDTGNLGKIGGGVK